jgi:hypothetical protein
MPLRVIPLTGNTAIKLLVPDFFYSVVLFQYTHHIFSMFCFQYTLP